MKDSTDILVIEHNAIQIKPFGHLKKEDNTISTQSTNNDDRKKILPYNIVFAFLIFSNIHQKKAASIV